MLPLPTPVVTARVHRTALPVTDLALPVVLAHPVDPAFPTVRAAEDREAKLGLRPEWVPAPEATRPAVRLRTRAAHNPEDRARCKARSAELPRQEGLPLHPTRITFRRRPGAKRIGIPMTRRPRQPPARLPRANVLRREVKVRPAKVRVEETPTTMAAVRNPESHLP